MRPPTGGITETPRRGNHVNPEPFRRSLYRLRVSFERGMSPERLRDEGTRPGAALSRSPWDGADDEDVLVYNRHGGPLWAAQCLGRTLFAVEHRLKKLRADGQL